MNYCLGLGCWNSIFVLPTDVIDKHIKLVGSSQIKVLLWIFRYPDKKFSSQEIAKELLMHEEDVDDAVRYWVQTGILLISEDKLLPGAVTNPGSIKDACLEVIDKEDKVEKQTLELKPSVRVVSRPIKPDNDYVTARISESEEIASLMQEAQVILGRLISNGDAATLLMLHENDGLPVDVIIMLMQYAVSVNKANIKYIEKVGISWAEEDIDTIDKAEKKIRTLDKANTCWRAFQGIIGIEKRSPTSGESEAVNRWINEWRFSEELIREAYERCINANGKYVFRYMDGIIKRWHNQGITTLEKAMDEKRPQGSLKSKNQDKKPSYDIEEYESYSIFDEIG